MITQSATPVASSLADAIRISFEDASADWFPPVGPVVDGLDAESAARRRPGANAPWQVLEHLAIGFDVWAEYLRTATFDPGRFGGGHEWEPVSDPSPNAWDELRQRARDGEAALRAAIAALPDDVLLASEPSLGGATRMDLILSTLAHLGFHAGELATLAATGGASRDAATTSVDGRDAATTSDDR